MLTTPPRTTLLQRAACRVGRQVARGAAVALLALGLTSPLAGCRGLPPPPGGGAVPGLLLSAAASVGTYFLIKELD
jgi:hypothetical protein